MIPFMIPIINSWGKCKIKSEGSSHCVHTHSSATFLRYLQLNAASPRFVTLTSSVAIFQRLGSASFLYVRFFYAAKTHMCPASGRVFKNTQHRTQLSSMITLYCSTKKNYMTHVANTKNNMPAYHIEETTA